MDAQVLFKKASAYLPSQKIALVEAAYQFALESHDGQTRVSGEPYLEHPLQTAITLADLQLDHETLAAALLHDVSEDCSVSLREIEKRFGPTVAKLVEGVTKLSQIAWRPGDDVDSSDKPRQFSRGTQVENLRRMLIAMAQDLRVVFIKLSDRLHNMMTLSALSPEKQREIARETMDIYAPLAHRLGISEIRWQLEDLSFRYLDPKEYHHVARLIAGRRAKRESFIDEAVTNIATELTRVGIKAEVFGRPKHIYSVYKKIGRYSALGKEFGDIHDLFAIRVIVSSVSECYRSLGAIHGLWHPITEEFDDFIANPKDTGYQSLHTTVMCRGTTPLEIQIRTYEMHRTAEYGVAAHWRYKEGESNDQHFEKKLTWLRQLMEWQGDLSSEEFLESLKTDIFIDQVYVFTPKGEIIDLPKGATPLDFAYRVHTELGHRCIGAKVNNRLVALNYELKNGDVVEVVIHKKMKGPSLDWLNPDLGYVKTSHTREKIRSWFKKQERTQNVERGRALIEKEFKRLGMPIPNAETAARALDFEKVEDFYAALGYGGLNPHQVILQLNPEPESVKLVTAAPAKQASSGKVEVLGVGDLLTRFALCCHPLPGDSIIGYITRNSGVTVHRKDCGNIARSRNRERVVDVNWGSVQDVYPATVQVDGWNRVGLLRDVTAVVAEEKVNISNVTITEQDDNSAIIVMTVEIKSIPQLTRLLFRVQSVRGVTSVERKGEAMVHSGHQIRS